MTRARRRRKRIWIATLCSLPAVLVAVAWVVGAKTTLLAPGRALPQRTSFGLAGNQFQFYSASKAVEFRRLPQGVTPPATGPHGPFGRQFLGARRAARVIDLREGVEWHGTFATHFTFVGVPMWLPLLATSPLLLVAARQVYLLRASSRRGHAGVCTHCGHALTAADSRCPGCGSLPPSSDPVSSVFLGKPPSATPPPR